MSKVVSALDYIKGEFWELGERLDEQENNEQELPPSLDDDDDDFEGDIID